MPLRNILPPLKNPYLASFPNVRKDVLESHVRASVRSESPNEEKCGIVDNDVEVTVSLYDKLQLQKGEDFNDQGLTPLNEYEIPAWDGIKVAIITRLFPQKGKCEEITEMFDDVETAEFRLQQIIQQLGVC